MDFLKQLFPRISSIIQSGGRSSAMKPILCVLSLALIGLWIVPSELKIVLAVVFCCCAGVALAAYLVLLFKDPRLLQSEHYQLAMRQMDLASRRIGASPTFGDENDSAELPPPQQQLPQGGSSAPSGEGSVIGKIVEVGK